MSSQPEPETRFEAWGQAVYHFPPDPTSRVKRSGTNIIFAVSDTRRHWLGWYAFHSNEANDAQLLNSSHAVLGEQSAFSSHFRSWKPITVAELTGPILYSRGRRFDGGESDPRSGRLARASWGHHGLGSDVIDVELTIDKLDKQENILSKIHLYIKRTGHQNLPEQLGWGRVSFFLCEQFKYPTKHINSAQRLRSLRKVYD